MKRLWLAALTACGGGGGTADGTHGGTVTIAQDRSGSFATAAFVAGDTVLGPSQGDVGPCSVFCPTDDAPPSAAAGTVTITGTTTPITLEPSPAAGYTTRTQLPDPLFTAGAAVSVSAAGDHAGVPAFTGQVAAPAALAGYTPPATVTRTGLTLQWTAVAGSSIVVQIVGTGSTQMSPVIRCEAADTGTLTIPGMVFGWMPAGFSAVTLAVARISETDVALSQGTIQLEALDGATVTPVPLQ